MNTKHTTAPVQFTLPCANKAVSIPLSTLAALDAVVDVADNAVLLTHTYAKSRRTELSQHDANEKLKVVLRAVAASSGVEVDIDSLAESSNKYEIARWTVQQLDVVQQHTHVHAVGSRTQHDAKYIAATLTLMEELRNSLLSMS